MRKNVKLTLSLDSALVAFLKAQVRGIGLHSTVEEAAIYHLRTSLLKGLGCDVYREAMVPHFPKKLRKAWQRPNQKRGKT